MVKKLILVLFLKTFLFGDSLQNALNSINSLSQTPLNINQSVLSSIIGSGGELSLSKIEEILGNRVDRAFLNMPDFEIKFISSTTKNALLFVKALKIALLKLQSHSQASFISRLPLEYAVRFESFGDTLSGLEDALSSQGLKIKSINRSDLGLEILLDSDSIKLGFAQLFPEKSIMILDVSEFVLSKDIVALELSSKALGGWTAGLRIYDDNLNELLYAKKEPDQKQLIVSLPDNSSYVIVSDWRGVSRGAMVLKALSKSENE